MLSQGQVGPITSTADGVQVALRAGKLGEQIVSELHARYYETNYRRALMTAANQSGQTTSVGFATTYTGLCLSNPLGSGVNLVLTKVDVAFSIVPAAVMAVGVMTGYNGSTNVTHTTPGTPRSQFFGAGAVGAGLVDTAATLPTAPVLNTLLGSMGTAAITAVSEMPAFSRDLEGTIILPPGAYAAIYTSSASGASGLWASFSWEEVPA